MSTSPSESIGRLPEAPSCPFCDGKETEIMNPFGSQLSVATYWCLACRSPFEIMKWQARRPATTRGDAAS